MRTLLSTTDDLALTIQRVMLGAVMLPHGAQKLLGWLGGAGFSGTMAYFTETLHVPAPLALLVILGESLGALALIAGAGTRLAALGICVIMLGAVLMAHLEHGFFMNWFGQQAGEGFEYHLLALALGVPLAVWGGGRYSFDGRLSHALAERAAKG